jgi:hypothetical protein
MICRPCQENRHQDCEGPCDCPRKKEEEAIDRELAAVNRQDAAYAETVLSHLQFLGSPLTRLIIDGAGRDQTRMFVAEVISVSKAIRC